MAKAQHHVYYNLHRSCWSIMLRGKVTGHEDAVYVHGTRQQPVRFVVREGGRRRVLREGRKNVHAFVVGNAAPCHIKLSDYPSDWFVEVTYRPTSGPSFVRKDTGAPITDAAIVVMTADRKVFAMSPR